MSCLVFKCSEISLLSFCYDFSFDSVVVRQHTWYRFSSFKFLEVCFMAQDMVFKRLSI